MWCMLARQKIQLSRAWRRRALVCSMAGLAFVACGVCTVFLIRQSVVAGRAGRAGRASRCGSPQSSECLDRSRCVVEDGTQEMSIYVHDGTCSSTPSDLIMEDPRAQGAGKCGSVCSAALVQLRRRAFESGLLAQTPEDACLVVYGLPRRSADRCVTTTPTWNFGQNHLLVDFTDLTRGDFPEVSDGMAMFASSNMQPSYFRPGHDIAVPLPPKKRFDYLAGTLPTARAFFATFKGNLYLDHSGYAERGATLQIGLDASSPDVVVLETCQDRHGKDLEPPNLETCQLLEKNFSKHNYSDLMNTTFALVPAGRSPATFRLGEAMSAGSIPVFLHESYVKPFPSRIPWHLCSFSFPIEEAPVLIDTLRAVPEETLVAMQATVLQVYHDFFEAGIDGIVDTTLDILKMRMAFRSERRLRAAQ